ncbi:hypothetical protein BDL97_04G107900 [Sphagnum fallax]|nr:hypothetical protein BDL97_04G107900 [Sphagnum fallax]KAH8965256.1 hypothetical protein BDL97_04G107900 [Sphagnum fallax]
MASFRRDHMEGIHAAGTHLSKCRLKFAAAEGAYGTFMGHQSAVVEAAAQGARRDVSRLLESSNNIPIQDLNYAIFQAAKRGHKYILQSLIDAGGTDLNAAMEAAGWSGHTHIVDELMLSGHVHIGRAFLGAMLACRDNMIDHLISIADTDGLESGLRVGASLIWSRMPDEVDFLSRVIDQLVKAGAKTFEDALLSSCNGTAILHLNGHSILQKSKIFDRLVLESSNLTKDFYNSLLLQACVCFLYRMTILEAGDAALVDHCDVSVFVCESVPFLPKVKRMQHILESGTATQDMLKIFSILFRNGIGLISPQLHAFVDVPIEKARALLQIQDPSQGEPQATGASSRLRIESRAEWPLKMMKYLLTQCSVNSECAIEQAVASSTHLGVMLPVLELLVGCDCLAITDPYVVLAFATAFRQTAAIRYLLDIIPKPVNVRPMMEAFKTAASENIGPEGVLFLLHLNFLDDAKATLRAASMVAELEDTTPDLKLWLREEWSKEAYIEGVQTGSSHYLNLMRVIKLGQGRLCIRELPAQLQAAIGYLPLYKDCCKTPGTLLSQRQKGELVEALRHLYRGSRKVSEAEILRADKAKLLFLLGACLPEWSQLPADGDVRTPMSFYNNRI